MTSKIRRAIQTGYRLIDLTEYPALSEETVAYSATITKDGAEVGTVTNDGHGGADLPRFTDRATEAAFEEAAQSACPDAGDPFWATEDFLESLHQHALLAAEIDQVAAKQAVLQRPSDGDWLDTGLYCTHRLPAAVIEETLRGEEGDWRIWDSTAGDFRSVRTDQAVQ